MERTWTAPCPCLLALFLPVPLSKLLQKNKQLNDASLKIGHNILFIHIQVSNLFRKSTAAPVDRKAHNRQAHETPKKELPANLMSDWADKTEKVVLPEPGLK